MKTCIIKQLAVASIIGLCGSPALAHLGSFEPADGYNFTVPGGSLNWSDVSYYNAGQYGANSGGGSGPTPMAPNSGLWKIQSSPGGFYDTAANRATFTSGAPPYPTSSASSGTLYPIYVIGNHFGGRTGTALAMRNDNQGTGPIDYDYTLDTYDFGGAAPASITSGKVQTKFYFCPNPVDPGSTDKWIMSFRDSSASTGLQISYQRNNQVQWRPGSSGAWILAPVIADSTNYDGWDVTIDCRRKLLI